MDEKSPDPQALKVTHRIEIEITWKSILRLFLGGLLAYAGVLLLPILKLLVLSILLAVALYPLVKWANRRGWPKWAGHLLATATLVVLVVGCFAIIAPMVARQASRLGENLPSLRDRILAQLPASGPVHHALQNSMSPEAIADSSLVLQRALGVVQTALGGLVSVVVVMALAFYLIMEGPRTLKWLIVFFPAAEREKISEASGQISRLISSYVAGQFLISAFCAAFLFLVLTLLGVPMAFLLGIVAGICDILPIIGFFIAVLLAMLMALTVSPGTAGAVFVLYGAYHLFENFYIVPRVYGKKLRLSKLAVPLAVAAGGLVAGVVGAIAVLPIVAAYPVIERLWLAPRLEPDTVKAHEEREE